jgi:carbamoyl-phosphate synthase large subunit
MINSNPETVSTDFDTSDKLYFEPLTLEDVLEIVQREQPMGVIVQLGGQTPLKLTRGLEAAGVNILGTSPDSIDAAEDRRRFEAIAREVGLTQPANGTVTSVEEALEAAERIGYPVLVRPSYVLGGRAMQIVFDAPSLQDYFATAARVSEERPVLIDRFLEDAYEVDVDALSDGEQVVIGGVMQHIEDAGIHSGRFRRACCRRISSARRISRRCANRPSRWRRRSRSFGLINVQFAIKNGVVYVLEVNPARQPHDPLRLEGDRRSTRVVCRARHVRRDARGDRLHEEITPPFVSVKEAVFPFNKFAGTDPVLGPEMSSTGEVMGIADSFGTRLRQGAARGVERAAARGHDPHYRERQRQGERDADRAPLPGDGLLARRHWRHGALSPCARHPGAQRVQGA